MLKSFFWISQTVFVLLIAAPAWAAEDIEVQNKAYWLCKNQKEVRTIRVQISNAGVCSTYYSKQGTEKVVGSGKNHDSCMSFMNNIRTNLEKSNWACRDISATRITASSGTAE
jgi:hypothetical protein